MPFVYVPINLTLVMSFSISCKHNVINNFINHFLFGFLEVNPDMNLIAYRHTLITSCLLFLQFAHLGCCHVEWF
ncbi:hypothetical protein L6452_43214 [Arctium lappa]|uniref:Uncharacterized protein n=1 Tax=Arctium lappa TaxID=4217 RepID=A0ACB8XL05_ARCLA|nr:hypothetical protein L6452_43214 [Arctium lappa]